MTQLASLEPDGRLDLVAALNEFSRLLDLGVKVVGVDAQRKANLFDIR